MVCLWCEFNVWPTHQSSFQTASIHFAIVLRNGDADQILFLLLLFFGGRGGGDFINVFKCYNRFSRH